MARKSAGPGTARAAAEARVDTLGRRIDWKAKLSPFPFQVAGYAGRELLEPVLARGKAGETIDCSVAPTQSAAAASLGGER
jgi:hypothetical protein